MWYISGGSELSDPPEWTVMLKLEDFYYSFNVIGVVLLLISMTQVEGSWASILLFVGGCMLLSIVPLWNIFNTFRRKI